MSTDTPTCLKRTAGLTDPRPSYVCLGVDADDRLHVYSTRTETVHVFADGDRVERKHVVPDSNRSVHVWVRAVDEAIGWADQRMPAERGQGFALLADRLIDGVQDG